MKTLLLRLLSFRHNSIDNYFLSPRLSAHYFYFSKENGRHIQYNINQLLKRKDNITTLICHYEEEL